MKNKEIRGLSTKEIADRLVSEKHNLIKLIINHAVSLLENPKRIKEVRRLITRL